MALYALRIQRNIYAIGSFDTFRGTSSRAMDSTKGITLNLYCACDPFSIPIQSYIIYDVMQAVDARNKEEERRWRNRQFFEATKNHENICVCL